MNRFRKVEEWLLRITVQKNQSKTSFYTYKTTLLFSNSIRLTLGSGENDGDLCCPAQRLATQSWHQLMPKIRAHLFLSHPLKPSLVLHVCMNASSLSFVRIPNAKYPPSYILIRNTTFDAILAIANSEECIRADCRQSSPESFQVPRERCHDGE